MIKTIRLSFILFFILMINTHAKDIYLSCESTTKFRTSFIINNKKINSLLKINNIKKMLKKPVKDNQEHHLIFAIINAIFFLDKYKKYI